MMLGGVAVLAVIVFVVLKRGGGETAQPQANPVPVATGGVTSPAPPTPLPPAVPVFTGRDPFQPPSGVTPTGGGGGGPTGGSGGTPAPSPVPTSPLQPPTSPSPSPSPTSSPSGGGGTRIQHQGHTVTLDDIFTRNGTEMAQVEVDGKVYTVKEGETFAQEFSLQSINDDCATFSHRNSSFTLCLNPQK
jgi:hypothetical protein